MKCVNHPETDSVAYCGQCGRPLCKECTREVRGMLYCETCLATRLQSTALPPVLGAGQSPGVALALGFIPGVGAIYNGQIAKAMIQVLVFGSLIAFADRVGGPMDTVFGLGAAAFYFYMVIDSYQTARSRQLGQPVQEWFGLGDMKMRAPLGAALLIGLGVLFLLDNLGIPVFRHLHKFWPVLLIAFGFLMLQRRLGGPKPVPPPSPPQAPENQTKGGPGNIPGPQGL
jgi:TM2 domain-containing membrane protein YozV